MGFRGWGGMTQWQIVGQTDGLAPPWQGFDWDKPTRVQGAWGTGPYFIPGRQGSLPCRFPAAPSPGPPGLPRGVVQASGTWAEFLSDALGM